MVKTTGARGAKSLSVKAVEELAQGVAASLGMELVEAALQKESRGKCLCLYIDKEGGVSLDDCERFHKQVQPLLEDVDYDILEVSSPGADRPIKTPRDVRKNLGQPVEVRLFAPVDGQKAYTGRLAAMDELGVTIEDERGRRSFERKAVAVVKPVIEWDEEAFENLELRKAGKNHEGDQKDAADEWPERDHRGGEGAGQREGHQRGHAL